jgi:uncharacterized phage protein (TIGR02218 family)
VVKPLAAANGRHFKCITAGNSGGSEPSWDTVIGNPTPDGTVTWEAIQALSLAGTVTGVTDLSNFAASALTEPDDWWKQGKLTWDTGDNAGRSMEIKSSTSTGGVFELYLPMPDAIQVGDTFTIEAGCGKRTATDCLGKFDNMNNARAEPYIPGTDALVTNET